GANTGSRKVQNQDHSSSNTQRGGRRTKRTHQESLQENVPSEPRAEQPRQRRPRTINLDVTFSSEDEDNLPLTPSPPPSTYDDLTYALTPSPPRSTPNDLNSDVNYNAENENKKTADESSEDESDSIRSSPVPKKFKSEIPVYDGNSSSDDDDPFAIDFVATKKKAMENACRDFDIVEKEERQKEKLKEKENENVLNERKSTEPMVPSDNIDQPELEVIDDDPITVIEKENKKYTDNFFSEIGISPSDINSPTKHKIKMSRKTKKALDQYQKLRDNNLQERLNATDDHDNSDILILSDEEEDTNAEQTIRIRWGQDTLKFTLRRLQKFFIIYQKLAEINDVSVNLIILCHKDKILSPESCPGDLGITAADILEGGIQNLKASQDSSNTGNSNEECNPDNIELKVQNANNKGSLKVYISKYDKMAILMHKYAEEFGKSVKQFKFMFDGEVLKSDDTPESLDLDGGECIDAYELS
ncbi:unnamed protein product, partial [Meganyctiphanes norvegica]